MPGTQRPMVRIYRGPKGCLTYQPVHSAYANFQLTWSHRFLGQVGGASQGWHFAGGCPKPLVPRVGDCPGRQWPSGFVFRSGHLRLGNYCGCPPQFNLNLGGSRLHTETDSSTVTFSSPAHRLRALAEPTLGRTLSA